MEVTVTLAKRRMYRAALLSAQDLGLDVPLITYQGALLKTSFTKEVIYHQPVPLDLARQIITVVGNLRFHLNVYMQDMLYTEPGKLKPMSGWPRFLITKLLIYSLL